MNRMNKIMRSPYVSAFLLTLFSLLLFLVAEPSLSRAGDYNIAAYLTSSKIEPGFFFISPALVSALRFLNTIYTASWWVIFSVSVMFGGLFIFLWFLNKRFADSDWTAKLLLDGLFVLFYWELMLRYDINFTQTTTIAALTGITLILDCCYDDEIINGISNKTNRIYGKQSRGKYNIIKTCLGICLLFVAGSVRWKALAMMLPFSIMCLAYFFLFPFPFFDLLKHPVRILKNSFQTKKKFLLQAGVIVLVVSVSFGLHKMYEALTPDLGEYVKANALREEICDYMDQYPDYDTGADMYRELGIELSWINMVRNFLTGDENYFTSADLNKMAKLKQRSHMTIEDYIDSLKGHVVLWIGLACLVSFVILRKGMRNSLIPLIGCFFAFVLCGLYFAAIGRIAWRVTDGCILACLLSFIAMSSHSVSDIAMTPRPVPDIAMMLHPVSEIPTKKMNTWKQCGLLVLTAVFCVIGLVCVRTEKEFSFPIAAVTDVERAGMQDYMDANSDIIYLDLEDALTYYNAHSLWSSYEPEYMDNVFSLIGHFVIGEKDTLAMAGIDDIINDMLEKPNIYVRYSPGINSVFLNYLKDYYDENIAVSVVDRYGSSRFLRYCGPIDMANNPDEDGTRMSDDVSGASKVDVSIVDVKFEVVDEFPEDAEIIAAIQVNGRLDTKAGNTENSENVENNEKAEDDGNAYRDYYLNITDHKSDDLYSYGLKAEETGCSGEILWMDGTWEMDDISVSLVGKRTDGSHEVIADVTEEFATTLSGAKH